MWSAPVRGAANAAPPPPAVHDAGPQYHGMMVGPFCSRVFIPLAFRSSFVSVFSLRLGTHVCFRCGQIHLAFLVLCLFCVSVPQQPFALALADLRPPTWPRTGAPPQTTLDFQRAQTNTHKRDRDKAREVGRPDRRRRASSAPAAEAGSAFSVDSQLVPRRTVLRPRGACGAVFPSFRIARTAPRPAHVSHPHNGIPRFGALARKRAVKILSQRGARSLVMPGPLVPCRPTSVWTPAQNPPAWFPTHALHLHDEGTFAGTFSVFLFFLVFLSRRGQPFFGPSPSPAGKQFLG